MSYKTQYVHLPDDKSEHIIGDGQRTECGVPIPYNSPWTTEAEGSVCGKCKTANKKADEAAAELDNAHEAEILASAPPVEAPVPTPDAGPPAETAQSKSIQRRVAIQSEAKAKSGDKA